MPRARQLKFSLFKNEILGVDDADLICTVMFQGLWCLADRDGRLVDRPLKIKGELFPLRTINNPDAILQWLADHGFIERYEVDGEKYIQIVNFGIHQNPHPNEKPSVIPKNVKTLSKSEKSRIIATTREKQQSTRALTSLSSLSSFPSLENGAATQAEAAVPAEETPVERRIWKDGIDLLKKNGTTEANARPLLGRLAKQYTKPLLAQAIAATQAENPADPKAFLIGVLKERSGANSRQQSSVGKYDPDKPLPIQTSGPCAVCGREYCLDLHRDAAVASVKEVSDA